MPDWQVLGSTTIKKQASVATLTLVSHGRLFPEFRRLTWSVSSTHRPPTARPAHETLAVVPPSEHEAELQAQRDHPVTAGLPLHWGSTNWLNSHHASTQVGYSSVARQRH